MELLSKYIIRTWILPSLAVHRRDRPTVANLTEIVGVILYKIKTGCQWRFLPVKQFFTGASLTWQEVYARFNVWRKDKSWKNAWLNVLRHHKRLLDLASLQLDVNHTPAKNGGAALGYHGHKKARTINTLFLADNQGQPLACATSQAVNHHDTHQFAVLFDELCALLEAAGIAVEGLFLNTDSGFDTRAFRQQCAGHDIEANIARNPRATNW